MASETSRLDSEIPQAELERIARGIKKEEADRIRRAHHELFVGIMASLSPEELALRRRESQAPFDLL